VVERKGTLQNNGFEDMKAEFESFFCKAVLSNDKNPIFSMSRRGSRLLALAAIRSPHAQAAPGELAALRMAYHQMEA
jgi:hypothetical protein